MPRATKASNAGDYSDAPECDAVLQKVATDVVPCLRRAHPENAQLLEDWLQQARRDFRLHGDVSEREGALRQLEENCGQQWRYRNKMLADDSAMRSCALP